MPFDRLVLRAFSRLVERQRRTGLSRDTERAIADALGSVRLIGGKKRPRKTPLVRALERAFHRLYYGDVGTWRTNTWLGVHTWKAPTDLWLYQELVVRIRPGLIIETGTAYGGSALFLATMCDAIDHGRVVSIDIAPKTEDLPKHERISYLRGSSTDPAIVSEALAMVPPGEPVLVILDSDHREAHVRAEMTAYADAVTPGSYLIVEDTHVNGHPVAPGYGPGPWEAVDWFLEQRDDFSVDRSMHRQHLTFNPRGYLSRK